MGVWLLPAGGEGYLFVKLITVFVCGCARFSVANSVCPVVVVFNLIFYYVIHFVFCCLFLVIRFFFCYLVISWIFLTCKSVCASFCSVLENSFIHFPVC